MDRYCKHCKFQIVPASHTKEVLAQSHGYCSDVCRRLYEEEKDYVIQRIGRLDQ
jgi:hypothetical protein